MASQVTLGGNRLGSGNKQKVTLHGFERSTHDIGYVWRNTQAPGTLVPFMNIVALPGDTFDINLGADVKTHPTLGPLFASFKLQLDVFQCPMRLYHAWLHNNKLKIGNNISTVKFPILTVDANPLDFYHQDVPLEFQQINQSSLLAYLGIRGAGNGEINTTKRDFNALSYLSYWDIYKNYYANKSEEIGYMIHTERSKGLTAVIGLYNGAISTPNLIYSGTGLNMYTNNLTLTFGNTYGIRVSILLEDVNRFEREEGEDLVIWGRDASNPKNKYLIQTVTMAAPMSSVISGAYKIYDYSIVLPTFATDGIDWTAFDITGITPGKPYTLDNTTKEINLAKFNLEDIDEIREKILQNDGTNAFDILDVSSPVTKNPIKKAQAPDSTGQICSYYSQEGLAIKTYQSDQYNNWLSTEWLDGSGGINEITAIDTSGDSFDINTLNLAQKVYDMLNRIAVSGGSYDDWIEAVYDNQGYRKAETPMYMGGLSKEIIFQEVVSTALAEQTVPADQPLREPLGTLAGKGSMAKKHKGGKITIKVNEPSIIMGIVSITPRIDYYQGNDWTQSLKTMDDLHKPNLDEIGFQDLITDNMAFWDTGVNNSTLTLSSAGKQPAWLNYMTNVNKLFGNFADERNEMFMTLARRYQADETTGKIKDLTSYIDPTNYNYAFAQTDLTAQNFWVQIGCDITARRKMSAKIMPNL